MASEGVGCKDGHEWRPFDDGEVKDLRTKTRGGRPPGAWVEGASRCAVCGAVEARVSWFGQVHQVPVAPKQPGGPAAIHWPARP